MSLRWMTLGMASILLSGLASGETVSTEEQSFSVSGRSSIWVRNEDGRTQLTAGNDAQVRVKVEKEVIGARSREDAEELAEQVQVRIEQRGDRIEVETHWPHEWSFRKKGDVRVHIDISAPRQSDLDVATEDGPLTVAGFDGELRLGSEDGNVEASGCSGTLTLSAEDGDVELNEFRGTIRADVQDGDLRIAGTLEGLRADSEDGDIDVRLAPESAMAGEWSVRTEDGTIRIALPDNFAADLDVDTGDDGSVDIDVPNATASVKDGKLSTVLNGGGHRFSIRTEDGSVRLTRT